MTKPHPRASLFLAAAVMLAAAHAQESASPAAKVPVYDVVSVKLNKTGSGQTDIDSDDGNFRASNVSLKNMLINAYDLKEGQLIGLPSWGTSARFDIQAKVLDPDKELFKKLTLEQYREMQQPILTERFQLKSHAETKVLPVYELVVAKGGPKFKPTTAADDHSSMSQHNRDLTATGIPMTALATALSSELQRVVVDKTGLIAHYDFTLKWSRDDAPPEDSAPPTLITALQEQLGLKLVPSKAPVPTFVIDHVEMPSEN